MWAIVSTTLGLKSQVEGMLLETSGALAVPINQIQSLMIGAWDSNKRNAVTVNP